MIIAIKDNKIIHYGKELDVTFDVTGYTFYKITPFSPQQLTLVPLTTEVFLDCGNNVHMSLGKGNNPTAARERLIKFLAAKNRTLVGNRDNLGNNYIFKTIKWSFL